MTTERATETESASAKAADQPRSFVAQQSRVDDVNGTVESATPDSTIRNIDNADADDDDCFVDVSPVDNDREAVRPTDGTCAKTEAAEMLEPEVTKCSENPASEMSFDKSAKPAEAAEVEDDEKDGVREEPEEKRLCMTDERNRENDLETEMLEMSSGLQNQLKTVEDFNKLRTESTESGDGDHPVEDSTKTSVLDSNGVLMSTPVNTEPPQSDDDEQISVSPSSLQSNFARPLPVTSALLFPGDGPPVPVIHVTCGDCRAEFHVDRLVDGLSIVSNGIGTSRTSLCVRTLNDDDDDGGVWMTPNQFQRASGRGTARDWKRSIKHHGVSLKSLMTKDVLSFDSTAPGCRCNLCAVSVQQD